jgi:hypothetical protein
VTDPVGGRILFGFLSLIFLPRLPFNAVAKPLRALDRAVLEAAFSHAATNDQLLLRQQVQEINLTQLVETSTVSRLTMWRLRPFNMSMPGAIRLPNHHGESRYCQVRLASLGTAGVWLLDGALSSLRFSFPARLHRNTVPTIVGVEFQH